MAQFCSPSPAKTRRFIAWLTAQGAEILAPTNPYEIIRFRCRNGTGLVHRKKTGAQTWNEVAREALLDFDYHRPFGGAPAKRRRQRRPADVQTLFERDGAECFYCPAVLTPDTATVEHLVPIAAGGTNHIANKALACFPCNLDAGHRPLVEKVRIRESKKGLRHPVQEGAAP